MNVQLRKSKLAPRLEGPTPAKSDLSIPDQRKQITGWSRGSVRYRENVKTGDIPFRKARIVGDTTLLEQAIIGSGNSARQGVRSFVRKWRTRQDSNL